MSNKPVRVRFAPNPSGELHIGSARAALFNWLYARRHGGTFIVRIEDTDPATAKPEYIQPVLDGLRWLGLQWDEGPEVGGPYGPYFQSHRRELHLATLQKLIDSGAVYRCTCTPEEVKARGASRGYDRHCRDHDPVEGRPFAWRFRVPDSTVTFNDLIRGEVSVEGADLQDFVVCRSDGSPTFVLANASDDIAMEISHAIRGEDLISAATQTKLIYDALGTQPPQWAHLPLILDEKRAKLSKRRMSTGLHAFRDKGFLPQALVNFLALMGWSSPTLDEILDTGRLTAEFDLDRVQSSGAVFDTKKLEWMNAEYLKALTVDEFESAVVELYPSIRRDILRRALELEMIQTRVTTLSEIPDAIEYLEGPVVLDSESVAKSKLEELRGLLADLADALEGAGNFDLESIEAAVRGVVEKHELNMRKGTAPIRVAIAGSTVSLPLFESMLILGLEETVRRLRAA